MRNIRYMKAEDRERFNARLAELAKQGRTQAETAATLSTEFSGYGISVHTVKNQGQALGIGFTGQQAEPIDVDAALRREQEQLHQRELTKELRGLQRSAAKRQLYVNAIESCLIPYEPSLVVPTTVKTTGKRPEHFYILDFSDWHVGQQTPIQTTGGIYEQTTEVTRSQVDQVLDALESVHRVQAQGQEIRHVLMLFDGDLMENDCLRPSQAAKIDRFATQQAVEVFDLMGYVIRRVLELPGIESIQVENVGGNHDRTTQRVGSAGLGELDYVDTYAWLIGELLRRSFAEEPRVTVRNWETFFGYTQFGGCKVLFEHGSSFRMSAGSYGGVPWYPIINSATKLMAMVGDADLVIYGHVHRPGVLPIGQNTWLVVNGSLPATSDYAQSALKVIREPMQWLINLHKEHGVIEFHPLYAPPASLQRPGAVWREEA